MSVSFNKVGYVGMTRILILYLVGIFSTHSSQALEFIAHRANYDFPIENSVEGTRRALASSVDGIELDVRVSTDGFVYLFHDDEVDGEKLNELSFAEVRARTSRASAPLLTEIFALGEPRSFYLLDLKIDDFAAIGPLVSVVRESGIGLAKVIFQSRRLDILQQIEHKVPLSKRIYLTSLKKRWPLYRAPSAENLLEDISGFPIDGISLKGRRFLDAAYIATLREAGLDVYVWTVNDMERIQHYVAMGVDGLITDKYREVEKLLAR